MESRARCVWSACWAIVVPAAFGLLAACGGGGGPPASEPGSTILDLGVLSATQPSLVSRELQNPLDRTASVSAIAPADGSPFAFDAATLPTTLAQGTSFTTAIHFLPTGPGDYTQELVLVFTGGGEQAMQTYQMRATAESMNWTLTPSPLDFGPTLTGTSIQTALSMRNGSAMSPITFESASITNLAFSVVGAPFPLTILPGQAAQLTIEFAPTELQTYSGRLRLQPVSGSPLQINVDGRGTATGEQITDFGNQTLTNDVTPELTIDVPMDAVSLLIEASSTQEAVLGLYTFTGPGDHVYETANRDGPYRWFEAPGGFAAQLPLSDRAELRLRPGGGTYRFRFQRISGASGPVRVRAIIERRNGGTETAGVLPLNVFLANGIVPTAATAANDATLQGALTNMDNILAARGLTLGDVAYYDVPDPSLDTFDFQNPGPLMTQSANAAEVRLNVFFVQSLNNGQFLGFSPALSGTKLNGLANSGVAVAYTGLTAKVIGFVCAHEACHHLSVWHTVEGDGTYDQLDDTPQCPVFGTDATCPNEGGNLLMHWQATLGTMLSATQGQVLRRHPLVEPSPADLGKPRSLPAAPQVSEETRALLRLHRGWCGTCER